MFFMKVLPPGEEIPADEFRPRDRYAFLVLGKNKDIGFAVGAPKYRWAPWGSNLPLYDWELLMTGAVDLGERSPLNAPAETRVFLWDVETTPAAVISDFLGKSLALYGENNGRYREVIKVWSGTSEVLPEFQAAVSRLATLSDQETLTTIILFSHGGQGSVDMGTSALPHEDLLRYLDTIQGKKVVFMYSCHSGSFLEAVQDHPKRRDYAAIASCEAGLQSTTWNDSAVDDFLFRHFCSGRKISELESAVHHFPRSEHYREPAMVRYFDARLFNRPLV